MEMRNVTSSNIAAVGYDKESKTFAVRFNNGAVWHYEGVPEEVAADVESAQSVGRAFNAQIKPSYKGTQQ